MMVVVRELYVLQKPNTQILPSPKVSYQKNPVVSIASISKFRATKVYPAPHHFSIRALYTSYTTLSLAQHQAQSVFRNKYVCLPRSLSSPHRSVYPSPEHRNKFCCKDQRVLHPNLSSSFLHRTAYKVFAICFHHVPQEPEQE